MRLSIDDALMLNSHQERGRLFLDLIETGIAQGESVEQTVVWIANSRDPVLGKGFQRLASYLSRGCPLSDALKEASLGLPPQLLALLKAGEQIGDVRKVLPACRQVVEDASPVLTAIHRKGVLSIALTTVLIAIGISQFLAKKIYPFCLAISAEFLENTLPPLSRFLFEPNSGFVQMLTVLACLLFGGFSCARVWPRLLDQLQQFGIPLHDALRYWVPWKRKRLHRDFSFMLALSLDAGIPEVQAIQLAAASVENRFLIRRVERVVESLRQGIKLADAVHHLDPTGEFEWRLRNAIHHQGGFHQSLSCWHEAINLRALQQEQAVAQVMLAFLILLNGVIVGLVCTGIFQFLTAIIQELSLW